MVHRDLKIKYPIFWRSGSLKGGMKIFAILSREIKENEIKIGMSLRLSR